MSRNLQIEYKIGNPKNLSDNELAIAHRIRSEAETVKDCYTKFSFQAMGLSAALLGLLVRFQLDEPLVGLASILVIALLLLVARIGIHKIESANRLYGFELHLHRRRRLPATLTGWKNKMRHIGWEEAFYAWRIIQPTIYHALYDKSNWYPTRTKPLYDQCIAWVSPTDHLKQSSSRYAAGSYLQKTFFVLHVFAIAACVPLFIVAWQLFHDATIEYSAYFSAAALTFAFAVFLFVVYRISRIRAKREILQNQLLSINTCAIIWTVVVIAHFRALDEMDNAIGWGYQDYTSFLYEQAEQVTKSLPTIYDWCS